MRTTQNTLLLSILTLAISIMTVHCDDDDDDDDTNAEKNGGDGTLKVEVWGEAFIEEGIPADEFEDGWQVTFDKFLINLGEIEVAEEGKKAAFAEAEMKVWDLTQPGPLAIGSTTAPAGEYTHTAYTIGPAKTSSSAGNASEDDLQMMIDDELSIYIAGTATDGEDEITFEWGFDTDITYDPCHSKGVLKEDKSATVQITIHGDHLFYDDAVSADPSLRFADIANADAEGDGDGDVTQEELEDYEILPLDHYGVGSLDDIDNMWEYIAHMTSTLGHIDGEGHCGE